MKGSNSSGFYIIPDKGYIILARTCQESSRAAHFPYPINCLSNLRSSSLVKDNILMLLHKNYEPPLPVPWHPAFRRHSA